MANKRSTAGSRNRDVFRSEVSSLLADLGELAGEESPRPARRPAAAIDDARTGGPATAPGAGRAGRGPPGTAARLPSGRRGPFGRPWPPRRGLPPRRSRAGPSRRHLHPRHRDAAGRSSSTISPPPRPATSHLSPPSCPRWPAPPGHLPAAAADASTGSSAPTGHPRVGVTMGAGRPTGHQHGMAGALQLSGGRRLERRAGGDGTPGSGRRRAGDGDPPPPCTLPEAWPAPVPPPDA